MNENGYVRTYGVRTGHQMLGHLTRHTPLPLGGVAGAGMEPLGVATGGPLGEAFVTGGVKGAASCCSLGRGLRLRERGGMMQAPRTGRNKC